MYKPVPPSVSFPDLEAGILRFWEENDTFAKSLAARRDDFEEYVAPLWKAYNCTLSRVPATDWYFTVTAQQRGFQHRTVVGGHFIKLLEYSGKMKGWK